MSHLPIGATPENPQYVSLEAGPALKVFNSTSGESQISTVKGSLYAISNGQLQDLEFWDFVGAGPSNTDLMVTLKLFPSEFKVLQLPFINGLRISTQGKNIIIHYFEAP